MNDKQKMAVRVERTGTVVHRSARRRLSVDPGGDFLKESRKFVDYLFKDCPGDVADEIVVGYLKALRAEAARYPGTGAAHHEPQIKALIAALL
jgi:hypothetical protein